MKKIIFFYGLLVLLFAIFSYVFVDPNFFFLNSIISKIYIYHSGFTSILYTIATILFFGFYILFITKRKQISPHTVFLLIGISIIGLGLAYPAILSYDIFNYALTSKVLFFYKENPYLIKPFEFTNDPWLIFTRATNKIALYGPVWIVLTGLPFIFSFRNCLVLLLNFKILNALFLIGSCFFFAKLSKKREDLVLFALNPLILIETMVSSHNDISMVFLMLISFYFLGKKRNILGSLFFVLSLLIKYASLIALPIYLFVLIRNIRKENIDWSKIFEWTFYAMFVVFILSFIREEIYAWYALWFLPFGFLSHNKRLKLICILFSLSLLLSYIPYILLRSYSPLEIVLKMLVIFVVPLIGYPIFRNNKWLND